MKKTHDDQTLAQMQQQRFQEQRLIAQDKLKDIQIYDENIRKREKPKEMKMNDQKFSNVKMTVAVNRHDSSVKVFLDLETKEIFREDRNELAEIKIIDMQKENPMSNSPFGCIFGWNFLEANPFVNDMLFLMSESIDVDKRMKNNRTPLMIASLFGADKAVAKLIERGARVDAFDNERYTALHYAVYFGSINSCKILLEKGANVNFQNKFGTPLMRASRYGDVEVVDLLLAFGADSKIKNNFGDTALQLAKGCCWDIIKAHEAK